MPLGNIEMEDSAVKQQVNTDDEDRELVVQEAADIVVEEELPAEKFAAA